MAAPLVALRVVVVHAGTTHRTDLQLAGSRGTLLSEGVASTFESAELWDVVRGLLPPLDVLRAEPAGRRAPDEPRRPGPGWAEECRAMVTIATAAAPEGLDTEDPDVVVRTWFATDDALWSADGEDVREQPLGSVGDLLIWDVTGAMEALVRRSARRVMTLLGMDTDAGRAVGETIQTGSQQIAELARRLDTVITAFEWDGGDADAYRSQWSSHQRAQLDASSQMLAGVAALLRGEADAQDTASGEAVAGGGAAIGTPTAGSQGGGLLGWLDRHVGTLARGLFRTGEKALDFLGKVEDVLTGEKDWSVTALAASALSTVGAGVGAVVGGVKGAEQNWFDEAPGQAGQPVTAPTDPRQAGQYQPVVARPTDLPSIMQGVTDSYQVGSGPGSTGDVRITKVDNGTGTPAYIVNIPGTESWARAPAPTATT